MKDIQLICFNNLFYVGRFISSTYKENTKKNHYKVNINIKKTKGTGIALWSLKKKDRVIEINKSKITHRKD